MAFPLLALCFLLSGCVGNATLTFVASGPDARGSGSATCDGSGRLAGDVHAETGALHVRLADGMGNVLVDETFGDGPLGLPLRGRAGTWSLDLRAVDPFEGGFRVTFRC